MKKLKNKAFGRDFEHSGNEFDLASLNGWEDREADNVKSQEIVWVFPLGRCVFFVVSGTSSSVNGAVVGSAGHMIDLTGSEGLDGTKVDIIKPQVDCFVFPVAHDVIVPAGRLSSKFGLRHWPSVFRDVVFPHGPEAGAD